VFDIDDATKVKLASGARGGLRVERIGKELQEYEAVSTSLFVMSPSLLECLDALPQPSLTQGVQEAAGGAWSTPPTSQGRSGRTSMRRRCATTLIGCCALTATSLIDPRCAARRNPWRPTRWR
jgi:hypothetical protein